MLDISYIGMEFAPFDVEVEKGRVRFFAQAIGENNPIYTNETAAKEAGYRTLPTPPTFTMVLDVEGDVLTQLFKLLKLDVSRMLHGQQSFEYIDPIYAGDTITRTTLALYAGASGDHNPIHIDLDFAQSAGLDDVFAHGMLSMAYLGRMLTNWQPQKKLLSFTARFVAITHVNDIITCSGEVTEIIERESGAHIKCEIQATTQEGKLVILGEAIISA